VGQDSPKLELEPQADHTVPVLTFTPAGVKWLRKLIKYLRTPSSFIKIQLRDTKKTTTKTVAIGKVTRPIQFINPP
jgi:hypothetical protein